MLCGWVADAEELVILWSTGLEGRWTVSVFDLDNNRRQSGRVEGSGGFAEIYGDKEIPVLLIMTQLQCGLLAHEVVQEIPNGFWSHVLVGAGEVGKIHYCGGEASRKGWCAAPAALFRP